MGGVNKENDIYLYTRDLILNIMDKNLTKYGRFQIEKKVLIPMVSIQTILKVDERIFARVWGIGLFELVNNNFQFIENSELFSSNRINQWFL